MDGVDVVYFAEVETMSWACQDIVLAEVFGSVPAVLDVRVAQISQRVGLGRWSRQLLDL